MYAYSRLEYEYEIMNEQIENEMHKQKETALTSLSHVVHSENELFAKVLAYAWFDSQADAIKLADNLNLGKLDFLAINDDFEEFKEEYLLSQDEFVDQYAM